LSKEIIVNVEPRETRVAILENGSVVEVHLEREERVVGCIYKAKVASVLSGMDAAFVDIGIERNAFLYVGDVIPETDDELSEGVKEKPRGRGIADILKVGQELMVQVVKGPRGSKGARVSTRVSLPGRYLVLMPESDNLGVSRKIEQESERDRLKKLGDEIRPLGFGVIVRTEAEGRSDRDIRGDLDFLMRMWTQIKEKAKDVPAPGLVHQDLSLIYKTVRDSFGSDVTKMVIDSNSEYQKAVELIELMSPRMRSRLQKHKGEAPIFVQYGVEEAIENLIRRKVWLKSGGYLTIDTTEALTTIDVNTGKFVGSKNLSDTIVKTNLDAAAEIARQLRLRDIGGIIVLDMIDMDNSRDRQKVLGVLEKELRKDRARSKISHISPLGLIEMTRKRTGEALLEIMTEPCPHCQGKARVDSAETVSLRIERELRRKVKDFDQQAFLVKASPEVVFYLIGDKGEEVDSFERLLRKNLYIRAVEHQHVEKYEIEPVDPRQIDRSMTRYRQGDSVECTVVRNPFSALPRASAWVDGYLIELENGGKYLGGRVTAKLTRVGRSYALGSVPAKEKRR